jgi:hypothetical protein
MVKRQPKPLNNNQYEKLNKKINLYASCEKWSKKNDYLSKKSIGYSTDEYNNLNKYLNNHDITHTLLNTIHEPIIDESNNKRLKRQNAFIGLYTSIEDPKSIKETESNKPKQLIKIKQLAKDIKDTSILDKTIKSTTNKSNCKDTVSDKPIEIEHVAKSIKDTMFLGKTIESSSKVSLEDITVPKKLLRKGKFSLKKTKGVRSRLSIKIQDAVFLENN